MFGRQRATNRRFEYTPRYYNPAKDESLKRRMRIKTRAKRRNPTSVIWFAMLLIFALYIYTHL